MEGNVLSGEFFVGLKVEGGEPDENILPGLKTMVVCHCHAVE